MYKIIAFVLYIAVSLTSGQQHSVTPYAYNNLHNITLSTETYIEINRQEHANNLQDYDNQLEAFKRIYADTLNTLEIQGDMLIKNLIETNDRLDYLQASSATNRACVSKYRSAIPTIASSKLDISNCINTARTQMNGAYGHNGMLLHAEYTRSYLENYYNNIYAYDLKTCKTKFNSAYYYLNYTQCVVDVTESAQSYTFQNQKTFATQMNEARCTANGHIKKAVDCTYSVKNRRISRIAEANTLINKCLLGQDDCKQCSSDNTCSYTVYKNRYDVSYTSKTMANPFYGIVNPPFTDCFMIKIY